MMVDWLRGLLGRASTPDPADELERERRLAEAGRDRDRLENRVLETDQHAVTRGAGGGLLPPPGEWPSDRGARR